MVNENGLLRAEEGTIPAAVACWLGGEDGLSVTPGEGISLAFIFSFALLRKVQGWCRGRVSCQAGRLNLFEAHGAPLGPLSRGL